MLQKKAVAEKVCGLWRWMVMHGAESRAKHKHTEREGGSKRGHMYICIKVLNDLNNNIMRNPFTCELTHEQQVMNSGGKCLGCSSDTEPIVGMEPIDGPDGTPVAVAYSLEGYERYCHGCATQLYAFLPFEQEPSITDDELPF